ncbi:MAG: N-acetylmuramoyl-L-alanine amidase, partial [Melioribacteraceae bacterium]|nr:N-acetylmuramoyl-L-alanine amidase [Melioribacteraceae bacterium]
MKLLSNIFCQLLVVLLITTNLMGSDLIIKRGNQTVRIPSINVRGTEYVSSSLLANKLGANYFFNQQKQKAEIKFVEFNLKFTANNQFVILTAKKSQKNQIFQLPVSAKLMDDDIYIPIKYSVKYIGYASGLQTNYIDNLNTVSIESKNINTNNIIDWNETIIDRNNVKYDLFSAKIENKSNGTLLRIATKRKIPNPTSSISNDVLYIFLNDVTIDKNVISTLQTKGFIKNIMVKHVGGNPQLEIKLKEGYDKYEIFYDEDIGELLVSIHNKFLRSEKSLENEIEKWKFNVIVLDAGHGGKDPGAIGLNGIKEKDINLAVVKELGALIKKNMKDVQVVYTREDDSFVELYKRGKIANEKKGNLFISVHCNSTAKKPTNANGFEVYLLRPGRTKEAIDIAEFENSVINYEDDPTRYKQLNDENFILVSMAHAS